MPTSRKMPKRKVPKPSFKMTAKERKVWKDGLKACIAADPQRALRDWARRHKVVLTKKTVVNVARKVTGRGLSPPVVELTNVGHTRTTLNGVVSPLGQNVAAGVPLAAKKCWASCDESFEIKTTRLNISCVYKSCSLQTIDGKSQIVCEYDCSGTAITIKS